MYIRVDINSIVSGMQHTIKGEFKINKAESTTEQIRYDVVGKPIPLPIGRVLKKVPDGLHYVTSITIQQSKKRPMIDTRRRMDQEQDEGNNEMEQEQEEGIDTRINPKISAPEPVQLVMFSYIYFSSKDRVINGLNIMRNQTYDMEREYGSEIRIEMYEDITRSKIPYAVFAANFY